MVNSAHEQGGDISNRQYYLLAVAFFSGMAVMGVEISASRLMAPFFGTSLSIWSVIIGSVMIALTLGYYLGGILADKHPRMSFLATMLFFASLFMIFLPYVVQPLLEVGLGRFTAADSSSGGGQGSYAILAALIVSALMISAPVVVLGMSSPFLIRLDSLRSADVGRISGKVFAFSTLGSILGTFLPAFFLIPVIGTRLSFLLFGGLLLCLTLPSIERGKSFLCGLALLALVLAGLLGIQGWGTSLGKYLVKEKETNYQYVRIFRLPVPNKISEEATTATVLLTDAGLGLQSMWVEGRPYTDSWQDFFAIVPRIYDVCGSGAPAKRLLLIGLGGACAPYLMSQFYPDIVIDGVEIDPQLIEVAKPYFPFSSVKNLNIHIGDGRFFLRSVKTKYDVIVVDAFRPPFIPFHLATAEFFDQVKQHLTESGIMVMNVGSRGEMLVFNGIANTVASVLPHVYFAQYYSPEDRSTVFSSRFIVASSRDLALDNSEVEKKLFSVPDPQWRNIFETMRDRKGFDPHQRTFFRKIPFHPDKRFFRDDLSSLELLSEREFLGLVTGLSK